MGAEFSLHRSLFEATAFRVYDRHITLETSRNYATGRSILVNFYKPGVHGILLTEVTCRNAFIIAARTSWSLGAVNPTPPSTCLGTIKMEDAITLCLINFLREDSAFISVVVFLLWSNISALNIEIYK